ncbi:MAG: hypothetical protein ACKOUK_00260 [Verrucomicrobiota bacterium]
MNSPLLRLAAATLLTGSALATPVLPALDGELLFTSNQAVNLVGPVPISIHTATGLDFNDGDANDTPPVATNAVVSEASGDFAGLLNLGSRFRDFNFAPAPGPNYAVTTVGGFSFYLTSVTIDVNAPWLRLFGEGYVDAPGFERTLGFYELDILSSRYLNQVRSLTFYWETSVGVSAAAPVTLNSTSASSSVSETVSVMDLLGLSGSVLAGCWVVKRRSRRLL